MGKNNRYRNRNNVGNTNIVQTATTPVETKEESSVSNTPELIEDELTQKSTAPELVGAQVDQSEDVAPDAAAPEETQSTIFAVATAQNEDDKLISMFNEKLATFKDKLEGFGTDPKDFSYAAKAGSDVTKFVMKYPKPRILDALLAFFVENKDGAAAGVNILKGSTTLPKTDETALGVLFNLFSDLANRRVIAINPGFVNAVLKRPEIVNYYNRRREGIKANR